MSLDLLLGRFASEPGCTALIWRDRETLYGELLEAVHQSHAALLAAGLPEGAVVGLEADFSPAAVAMLLALLRRCCILVPLTSTVERQKPQFRALAEVEWSVAVGSADDLRIMPEGRLAEHPLLLGLKAQGHPGLVLFSSGSTGASKAALHDMIPFLEKFTVARPALRTMAFLLFDHIGGINTLFHTLSNGGCVIVVEKRQPLEVCQAIQRHRVELLPTSPTFLNLLLLSESWRAFDLSSLKLMTYGTEPMPESLLLRLHTAFPQVRLQQTYGLSEVGILRSKSRASDSLWMKVGGEGFETRVVDGLLQIKARSAMLGYLNAPSPFSEDGWFMTGDEVVVEGEYIRILGRRSEQINVGGEKVFPAEVEGVLQQMEGVKDATVRGEPSQIMGNIVVATIQLLEPEAPADFRTRMRKFCQGRLAPYKIPQKVRFTEHGLHGERFKKLRAPSGPEQE